MRIKRYLLSIIALLITLFTTAGLSQASPLAQPQPARIRLKAATFTPALGQEPAVPAALRGGAEVAGRNGYYLVQFRGPVAEAWEAEVAKTTAKTTANLTTREATYTLGSATDTWGRIWSTANFTNANFRVRIINMASNTSRDFSQDWVSVRVTYQ